MDIEGRAAQTNVSVWVGLTKKNVCQCRPGPCFVSAFNHPVGVRKLQIEHAKHFKVSTDLLKLFKVIQYHN